MVPRSSVFALEGLSCPAMTKITMSEGVRCGAHRDLLP